jgi:multidrug resistance efflux pump
MRMIPFLTTLETLALAAVLGSAASGAYMGAPWMRDATVRAYGVTLAPEVAGRIVELHVADNEYVRKGDPLMAIDPTNYTIVVSQAEAAVQQARASIQNIDAQSQGVVNVNPIFTWVRLAQRIPVRVHIEVPPGVILAAGMTATVEIDDPTRANSVDY